MKNVIVLIGAPATGKSKLATALKEQLNECRIFAFDELYPLERLRITNSKDARAELLQEISNCEYEWIIVDDTCHLHSMQKRYLALKDAKVVFVYLEARNDQIEELLDRNAKRDTLVSSTDICNILTTLNSQPPIKRNLISFNFKEVPEDLIENIKKVFLSDDPIPLPITKTASRNALHELNNLLNGRIHEAFKTSSGLDGPAISKAKREFLNTHKDSVNFDNLNKLADDFTSFYFL